MASAKNEVIVFRIVDTFRQLMPCRVEAAADHVTELFRDIGVSARWVPGDEVVIPARDQAEVVVLLRQGRPEDIGLAPNLMGVVLGKIERRRTVFVFLPSVARTLGVRLGGLSLKDERLLARALARVIVHEAFHAIAPELEHAAYGITRARMTRDDLVSGHAKIAPEAVARFRTELARLYASIGE